MELLIFFGIWVVSFLISFGLLNGNSSSFVIGLYFDGEKFEAKDGYAASYYSMKDLQSFINDWRTKSFVYSLFHFISIMSAITIYCFLKEKKQRFTFKKLKLIQTNQGITYEW